MRRPAISVLSLAAAGAITAGLAFVPWYAVDTPAGTLTTSGVAASPEIWTLVAVGAGIVALAVALAVGPPDVRGARRVGLLCAIPATALAAAWAIANALSVPVGLDVALAGRPGVGVAPDLLDVQVRPAAWLAAAAALIAGMAVMLRLLEEPPAA